MSFGFHNLGMLLGLAAVALPVLIHLLNRRRFDVVDWGAMQFLHISETRRRRLLLEEWLLLALRMLLIAVLVLALAAPYLAGESLALLGNRPNRDVVLVFDGSASMTFQQEQISLHEMARRWALDFVQQLKPGDGVAVLEARQQVVAVLGQLTQDRERVVEAIESLPPPGGGCDWPGAVQAALQILSQSQRGERALILLTDGQRYGWADEASLLRWSFLSEPRRRPGISVPRIAVVQVGPDRVDDAPNWSLALLRASRTVAVRGQTVAFQTALQLHGQSAYRPPHRLHLEVNGRPVADLSVPTAAQLDKDGQVPLRFLHRFTDIGSHRVSLLLEPDPPVGQRPPGYVVQDHLPTDNRQDYVLEIVPSLPVLLVDGAGRTENPAQQRPSDFLRDALAPARDPSPSAVVRVISYQDFEPSWLTRPIGPEPESRPRVLVLADVPQLGQAQQQAIERFLHDGGGVLVALGERVDAHHYNSQLYAGGQGWLPAALVKTAGAEGDPKQAVSPLPASLLRPPLELFREMTLGGLGEARFPRWWLVHAPEQGTIARPVGLLTGNHPFVVEKPFGRGRVLLCAVPLNNSWRTNLTDLPVFAPLVHELTFYLAGHGGTVHNLKPGEPLIYRAAEATAAVRLHRPGGQSLSLLLEKATLVCKDTQEPGIYCLDDHGKMTYYVVQADPREANLTRCNEADRENVRRLVPLVYENDPTRLLLAGTNPQLELWWVLLMGVVFLLCGEIWLTKRMAMTR